MAAVTGYGIGVFLHLIWELWLRDILRPPSETTPAPDPHPLAHHRGNHPVGHRPALVAGYGGLLAALAARHRRTDPVPVMLPRGVSPGAAHRPGGMAAARPGPGNPPGHPAAEPVAPTGSRAQRTRGDLLGRGADLRGVPGRAGHSRRHHAHRRDHAGQPVPGTGGGQYRADRAGTFGASGIPRRLGGPGHLRNALRQPGSGWCRAGGIDRPADPGLRRVAQCRGQHRPRPTVDR